VTETEVLEVSVHISARPETVFPYFTDAERYVQWMGSTAVLEPVAGGVYRVGMRNGVEAVGTFVEVDFPRRVVFTWGWTDQVPVAGGSTRVEVTLVAEDGGSSCATSACPPPRCASITAAVGRPTSAASHCGLRVRIPVQIPMPSGGGGGGGAGFGGRSGFGARGWRRGLVDVWLRTVFLLSAPTITGLSLRSVTRFSRSMRSGRIKVSRYARQRYRSIRTILPKCAVGPDADHGRAGVGAGVPAPPPAGPAPAAASDPGTPLRRGHLRADRLGGDRPLLRPAVRGDADAGSGAQPGGRGRRDRRTSSKSGASRRSGGGPGRVPPALLPAVRCWSGDGDDEAAEATAARRRRRAPTPTLTSWPAGTVGSSPTRSHVRRGCRRVDPHAAPDQPPSKNRRACSSAG
jgi:uncharacterized protein YndB with AHSA1/START domain